jgi:hypothetical protein
MLIKMPTPRAIPKLQIQLLVHLQLPSGLRSERILIIPPRKAA